MLAVDLSMSSPGKETLEKHATVDKDMRGGLPCNYKVTVIRYSDWWVELYSQTSGTAFVFEHIILHYGIIALNLC